MRFIGFVRGFALLGLGSLLSDAVLAADVAGAAVGPSHGEGMGVVTSRAAVEGLGPRVGVDVLAKASGGTDVTGQMTLNGTVSDNHTTDVATGNNEITSGSFSGAAGVPMVIQNTGNSVLIQNATIINVQFQP
ncbi:MAG: hypothetical protein WC617_09205 [Rhodanobacter sp.]